MPRHAIRVRTLVSAGCVAALSSHLVTAATIALDSTSSNGSAVLSKTLSSSRASTSLTAVDIGGAIIAGLGSSSTSTSAAASPSSASASSLTISAASSAKGTSPLGTASTLDCQAQLVSWSSVTAAIKSPYLTETSSLVSESAVSEIIQYGTADIYTTIGGFPHASGSFKVTSKTPYTTNILYYTTDSQVISTPASLENATVPHSPTCTIGQAQCASLYTAYRSSLGMINGDVLPFIWPIPSNSPRCTTTDTNTACTSTVNSDGCTISGSQVQLYYWPPQTATGNVTSKVNNSAPHTIVTKGVTMTSPTVYLSFDLLSAFTYFDGEVQCDTFADGAVGFGQIGQTHTNALFSLMPESISTLEKMRGVQSGVPFPDAAISAMASNGSEYYSWAREIAEAIAYLTSSRIDLAALTQPLPRAYYLRPAESEVGTIEQGCNPYGPHPACNTIFDDVYRAQLSVPPQIRDLDPAWSTCGFRLFGVYDPPIALALAGAASAPVVSTTTEAPVASTPASPSSAPNAPTAQPTPSALPDAVSSPASSPLIVASPSSSNVAPSDSPLASSQPVLSAASAAPAASAPGPSPATSAVVATSSTANAIQPVPAAQPAPASSSSPAQAQAASSAQVIAFSTPASVDLVTQAAASDALQALTQSAPSPSTASSGAASPASSQATPIAVFSAGGSIFFASSVLGNVVIGGTTLTGEEAATINGAVVSNAVSAVVVQPTGAQPASPQSVVAAASPLTTVGNSPVVPLPAGSGVVLGGSQMLTEGQAATVDGTAVSVGVTAVVIGSATLALPSDASDPQVVTPQSSPLATLGGQAVVPLPSAAGIKIGTATLTQGQTTTVDGTAVSVGATGVVIGGTTLALPTDDLQAGTPQSSPLTTLGGQAVVPLPSAAGVKIGTATLTQGQTTTVDGTRVSVGATNVVIDSTTLALPTGASGDPQSSPLPILGGDTVVQLPSGAGVRVGTATLTPGQTTTIAGTLVSVGSTDVTIGANTLVLPANAPAVPLTTFGGQSIVALPSGQGVQVGAGHTVAPGQVTAIDGTRISVGSSDIVIGSSTLALPAVMGSLPAVASAGATPIAFVHDATTTFTAPVQLESESSGGELLELGSLAVSLSGSAAAAAATSPGLHTATVLHTQPPALTLGSTTVTEDPANGDLVLGSQTLRPGGSTVVYAGTTYSLGPSDAYIVANGKTSTLPLPQVETEVVTYSVAADSGSSVASASATSTTAASRSSLGTTSATRQATGAASKMTVGSARDTLAVAVALYALILI